MAASTNELPRIALVGDSWVVGGHLGRYMTRSLLSNGWEVDVDSYGQRGVQEREQFTKISSQVKMINILATQCFIPKTCMTL